MLNENSGRKATEEKSQFSQSTDWVCAVNTKDPLMCLLHNIIRWVTKCLALLMVLVILWGVGDVIWVLYLKLMEPPVFLLQIGDLLATFGAFMAVLIAIEIFHNITLFLRDDVIHVNVVIATALMAIARKVIIFDFKVLDAEYIWASGGVILALGITYWLLVKKI